MANAQNIDDIPDLDGLSKDVDNLHLKDGNAPPAVADIPDMDDIPDMEEEGMEGEDEATAAAPAPPVPFVFTPIVRGHSNPLFQGQGSQP